MIALGSRPPRKAKLERGLSGVESPPPAAAELAWRVGVGGAAAAAAAAASASSPSRKRCTVP